MSPSQHKIQDSSGRILTNPHPAENNKFSSNYKIFAENEPNPKLAQILGPNIVRSLTLNGNQGGAEFGCNCTTDINMRFCKKSKKS